MGQNEQIVPAFDERYDESLDISLDKVPDIDSCLLLHLSGYVDTYNTALFQKRVNLAIEAGYIRLIFDCLRLNYFSSTGIGSLTSFLKAVKPRGGDIVLFGMQSKLMEIFQLLGFSQFFSIKDTQTEAVEHVRAAVNAAAKAAATARAPSTPAGATVNAGARTPAGAAPAGTHPPQTLPTFPVIIRCPRCAKRLRAPRAGRFRCVNCKSILAINERANVRLE